MIPKLGPRNLHKICVRAAGNICSPGAIAAERHNVATIKTAIVEALSLRPGDPYESALDIACATAANRKRIKAAKRNKARRKAK